MYDTYTSTEVAANPFEKEKRASESDDSGTANTTDSAEYYVSIEIYL